MNKPIKLIGAILVCQLAGIVGSLFTSNNIETWYAFINKPFLAPPNWVFAPVWTLLFLLMGVSLYLIISQKKKNKNTKKALLIFSAQLVLNIFWSIMFFSWHEILPAFAEMISLWLMIAATMLIFYKINKTAAYLLVPYILWVSFALILNFGFVVANR